MDYVKRTSRVTLVLLAGLLTLQGVEIPYPGIVNGITSYALAADSSSSSTASKRHVVEISAFQFLPSMLKVLAGDIIVFVNRDVVPHTATSVSEQWDSGVILSEQSWHIVATEDMTGEFICSYHPTMTGKVLVRNDRNDLN